MDLIEQLFKKFSDYVTWVSVGANSTYIIYFSNIEIYRTHDARDRDLFIAQIKGLWLWNLMFGGELDPDAIRERLEALHLKPEK